MNNAPFDYHVSEAPIDGKVFWVTTDDGLRLRVGLWGDEGNTSGTILFFTGRSEYLEKYGRTICDFVDRGYATFVIDWRGQGLSDRTTKNPKTGHIDSYSDYQKDVTAFINVAHELDLPKPWFLYGNSMGCAIGLRSLSNDLPVSACAFTAPMWGVELTKFERMVSWPITWGFHTTGYGHIYTPGRKDKSYVLDVVFKDNCLTSDPEMYAYYVHQANHLHDTQIGAPSMSWLYETLKECKKLKSVHAPATPCISFVGDKDNVISIQAVQNRMADWSRGEFQLVKGGKHDLLCEVIDIRKKITDRICNHFRDFSL